MHSHALLALTTLALSLVTAAPYPQDAAPVSTLAVSPAAISPEVTASNETSSSTTNPGAGVADLLGQLNDIQGVGGTAEGTAADPESATSSAFANFGGDSPTDVQGSAGLEGILQSIKQASALTSGMTREPGGTATGAKVLAAEPTSATDGASNATSEAVVATPTAAPTAAVLAADTTTAAPAIDTATTFDLNDFLDGANFPAEATTAIAGAA
ncbi:hypothetical protein JCM10449v2_001385 [Rhodotorula kratochvilovae]